MCRQRWIYAEAGIYSRHIHIQSVRVCEKKSRCARERAAAFSQCGEQINIRRGRHLIRASLFSDSANTARKRSASDCVFTSPRLIRIVQSASRSLSPNARKT